MFLAVASDKSSLPTNKKIKNLVFQPLVWFCSNATYKLIENHCRAVHNNFKLTTNCLDEKNSGLILGQKKDFRLKKINIYIKKTTKLVINWTKSII